MAKAQTSGAVVSERVMVKATIKNGELVIRLPIEKKPQPTSTGKSLLLCSTGWANIEGAEYKGMKLWINALCGAKIAKNGKNNK